MTTFRKVFLLLRVCQHTVSNFGCQWCCCIPRKSTAFRESSYLLLPMNNCYAQSSKFLLKLYFPLHYIQHGRLFSQEHFSLTVELAAVVPVDCCCLQPCLSHNLLWFYTSSCCQNKGIKMITVKQLDY